MNQDLHNEIAKIAYDLYQKEGCPEGRELIHWFQAEKIVKERHQAGPEETSGRTAEPERRADKKATKSRSGSRKKR
jgi:hypothetical protein